MAIIQGLEWTFNTVAEEYDKWSPEYVPELYADLFAYQPLTSDSEVLEIDVYKRQLYDRSGSCQRGTSPCHWQTSVF